MHSNGPSELDWFTFETKMRKVVADLLEPNIKRYFCWINIIKNQFFDILL